MPRIKDRRLKILQHLQRFQEGGVTDLVGACTRQVVKHRGSRNSGNTERKTAEIIDLYPKTADTDSLLDVRNQKKNSAKLVREGQ